MGMKGALCVAVLCSTPVYAQSAAGTFSLERTSFASPHEYVAAEAVPRQLSLPRNLIVSPVSREGVETMLQRSPSFRRQCVRIGGDPRVLVQVALGRRPRPAGVRAATRITRTNTAGLIASIDIFPLDDDVELIAHEIEHVIEQLDEVDLASYATRDESGVRLLPDQAFETTRARQIGLRVTSEVGAFSRRK